MRQAIKLKIGGDTTMAGGGMMMTGGVMTMKGGGMTIEDDMMEVDGDMMMTMAEEEEKMREGMTQERRRKAEVPQPQGEMKPIKKKK